jgi:hypothetical protein
LPKGGGKMEIAVVASLLAKWNVEIETRHFKRDNLLTILVIVQTPFADQPIPGSNHDHIELHLLNPSILTSLPPHPKTLPTND